MRSIHFVLFILIPFLGNAQMNLQAVKEKAKKSMEVKSVSSLSNEDIVSGLKEALKVGIEKALENFKKKRPGPAFIRESQIKDISKAKNLPVLVFTHPKDPYDGLLSDWVEKIPGVKRIVISQDYKINNKNCKRIGINNGERWEEKIKNGHYMALGDCFQHYNPTILDFIASKID